MKCGSKKKVKKFAAGGETKELPPFTSISSLNAEGEVKKPEVTAPKQSFGEAFKAARGAGSAEFTWNGKKYNTKLKEDSKPKMETVTVKASRLTPETDKSPVQRPGPSSKDMATAAAVFNRPKSRYQPEIDKADKYFRNAGASMRGFAKGGKVRGDGCASKGKTKGRMC